MLAPRRMSISRPAALGGAEDRRAHEAHGEADRRLARQQQHPEHAARRAGHARAAPAAGRAPPAPGPAPCAPASGRSGRRRPGSSRRWATVRVEPHAHRPQPALQVRRKEHDQLRRSAYGRHGQRSIAWVKRSNCAPSSGPRAISTTHHDDQLGDERHGLVLDLGGGLEHADDQAHAPGWRAAAAPTGSAPAAGPRGRPAGPGRPRWPSSPPPSLRHSSPPARAGSAASRRPARTAAA